MRYVVEHEARLHFDQAVREHQCELRLVPRNDPHQLLVEATLTTEPEAGLSEYVDYFGNLVSHVEIVKPHDELVTRLRAVVETRLENPFDFPLLTPVAERNWLRDSLQREPRLWDYVLHFSPLTPDITRLDAEAVNWPMYDAQAHLMDMLLSLRDWIGSAVTFDPDSTLARPAADVLKRGTGSAAELAHLLIAVVRRWGFAARYVTGYREPDDDADSDAVALHAWAEVLIPGGGWRGFDPTAALVVNDSYVAVGVGRDANDVVFLKSSFRGGEATEPRVSSRLQRQEGETQQ